MSWRLARSIVLLRSQCNSLWPTRDKTSDGTIGDANHLAEGWTASDHNPWVIDSNGVGVVRAIDIDSGPGLNPDDAHDTVGDTVAEAIRRAGLASHPALMNHGYVIYDRRIASAKSAWIWRPYTGVDPHTSHVHVSVGLEPQNYDSLKPFPLTTSSPLPSNPDGGPWGPFPIPPTHAFGPKSPGNSSWHDGTCHRLCIYAIREIRKEVGDHRGDLPYDRTLMGKVAAWQQYVHTHGSPGVPVDGVVRKVTWEAMTRR